MSGNLILLNRWRLILGRYSEQGLSDSFGDASFGYREMDELMEFLYQREYEGRDVLEGSLDPSNLTVVSWINKVHKLFPKETIEKLENHALEKYNLKALLTDKRVLEKLEPNINLLKQIMSFKGMMSKEVLDTARAIVQRVVDDLRRKLENRMRQSIMGKRDRNRSTTFKYSKNFDFKKTIARNLKHYDREREQIILQNIWFNSNSQRYNPWHIVVCVDESGSMLENVIHSAVMAGIFAKMPVLSVKLVIFDTSVVDLSEYVDDPVEALMSVQLGGGTDIGKALSYCAQITHNPQRTIMVLVSDLCDGAGYINMYRAAQGIIESGTKLICLTALNAESNGMYDKTAAKRLVGMGASVAALTPFRLADWIGEIIRN